VEIPGALLAPPPRFHVASHHGLAAVADCHLLVNVHDLDGLPATAWQVSIAISWRLGAADAVGAGLLGQR